MTPTARQSTPEKTTRDRLLDAAQVLFSESSFDGTSVRAIAARADCNLALIKHYFGSKEGLLHAVVARGMDQVMAELGALAAEPAPPEERLRRFIGFMVQHFARHHALFQIIHREMESCGTVPAEVMPRIAATQKLVLGLIGELQAAGRLRDVDPMFAAMLLMAMIRFYFMAQPVTAKFLGPPTPETLAKLERHITTVFLEGVLR